MVLFILPALYFSSSFEKGESIYQLRFKLFQYKTVKSGYGSVWQSMEKLVS